LKKIPILILLVIATCAILVFLFINDDSQQTIKHDKSKNNLTPTQLNNTNPNQVTEPNHDKSQSKVSGHVEVNTAINLLMSLKTAIAEGDWQKAKQLCEKLGKMPEAFDMLVEILLDNASTEENDIVYF
jgi:hypothetical protein